MYLTTEKGLYSFGIENDKKMDKIKKGIINLFPEASGFNPRQIVFEIGYWRKENAIHKWFVDNIQDGKDDCKKHYIDIEKLIELKELCQEVLKEKTGKKAKELLPTMDGFFFGDAKYGENYYSGLEETIKIVEKAEKLIEQTKGYYLFYNSSW